MQAMSFHYSSLASCFLSEASCWLRQVATKNSGAPCAVCDLFRASFRTHNYSLKFCSAYRTLQRVAIQAFLNHLKATTETEADVTFGTVEAYALDAGSAGVAQPC